MPTGVYKRKPVTDSAREAIRSGMIGKKYPVERCKNIGLSRRKYLGIGESAHDSFLRRKFPNGKGPGLPWTEQDETELRNRVKVCELCGKVDRRQLSRDHDHQTGKVRGLLCNDCNKNRVGKQTEEEAYKTYLYLKSKSTASSEHTA